MSFPLNSSLAQFNSTQQMLNPHPAGPDPAKGLKVSKESETQPLDLKDRRPGLPVLK